MKELIMRIRLVVALLSTVALFTAGQVGAEAPAQEAKKAVRTNANGSVTLEDGNLAFKLVLPKGTQEATAAETGDIAYAFQVGTPPDAYTVAIQKLHRPIAREFSDADAAKVKPSLPVTAKLVPAEWSGIKVMALRLEQSTPQGPYVDYGAQIPLSRDAIQLHVAGPAAGDEKLKKALTDLLGSLTGAPRAK
jgi:hypothetical protein